MYEGIVIFLLLVAAVAYLAVRLWQGLKRPECDCRYANECPYAKEHRDQNCALREKSSRDTCEKNKEMV